MHSAMNINEVVNEGLLLWAKVAIRANDIEKPDWYSWDTRSMTDELNESRDLDPTGVTTFMLLNALTEIFLESECFSGLELIEGLSPNRQERMDRYKALFAFLKRSEVHDVVDEFIQRVREAVSVYSLDREDVEAWLAKPGEMAFLRRDALQALKTLERHQFLWGEPRGAKAFYNRKIFEFWNMPSLLRAMQQQKLPGISICLIRAPEAIHSFFCIAISNGQQLTVFTDKPEKVYPGQEKNSRRPGRQFFKRIMKSRFPYELLNVAINSDRREAFAKARHGLVPYDTQAVPIEDFSKLFPETVIWASLLFDLIEEQFFKAQATPLLETSYTVEMLRVPDALVDSNHALVVAGQYKPLDVAPHTKDTIDTDVLKGQWRSVPVGHNQWMIERYGLQVPDSVLNLVGTPELLSLLPSGLTPERATEIAAEVDAWPHKAALPKLATPVDVALADLAVNARVTERNVGGHPLLTLNPLDFGVKKKIDADRVFVARKNFCDIVQRLANAEFDRTAPEIMGSHRVFHPTSGWYYDRVQEQKDRLIQMLANDPSPKMLIRCQVCGEPEVSNPKCHHCARMIECRKRYGENDDDYEDSFYSVNKPGKTYNLGRWALSKSPAYGPKYWDFPNFMLNGNNKNGHYICPLTGGPVVYYAAFHPSDPFAIAFLLGISVKDLPWQLQHYFSQSPYSGNNILERLDPADHMKNPWCHMGLSIGVALSRRGLHRVRKDLGLPPFDFEAEFEKQDKRWNG